MKHSPLLRDAHTTALPPRPGCTQRPESRGTVRQQQAGGRRDVQPFFLPQPMPWVMSMLTRAVKTQSLSARGAKGLSCPAESGWWAPRSVGFHSPRETESRWGTCLPGQGHFHFFFWMSLESVTSDGLGFSIFLPSIPEQEQFPASPAASWQEGEEHLNLRYPEEEFDISRVPGPAQVSSSPGPPGPAGCESGEPVPGIGHPQPPAQLPPPRDEALLASALCISCC